MLKIYLAKAKDMNALQTSVELLPLKLVFMFNVCNSAAVKFYTPTPIFYYYYCDYFYLHQRHLCYYLYYEIILLLQIICIILLSLIVSIVACITSPLQW